MATLSGNTAGWFSLPGDPGPIGLVGLRVSRARCPDSDSEFVEQGFWEGGGIAPVSWSLDERVTFSNILAEAAILWQVDCPALTFGAGIRD